LEDKTARPETGRHAARTARLYDAYPPRFVAAQAKKKHSRPFKERRRGATFNRE